MAGDVSRIQTDIDFEKAGKQSSELHVPISTNESAYGRVLLPITVVKNSAGPTVLLTGGNHGDEYEGPIILSRLSRELTPDQVSGRVIILPALNLPAVQAGARVSPMDGLNMNRIFPGNRDGSITLAIAHYVSEVLLPMTDVLCDFHSGGTTLEYIPSVMMHYLDDQKQQQTTQEALIAFGAPIAIITKELDTAGFLDCLAESQGIITLGTELAGAARVTREAVRIGETGVWNLLKHFQVVEGGVVDPQSQGRPATRLVESPDLDCFLMAPDDGLYESFFELGEQIEAGQTVGQVHFVHNPQRDPWVVESSRSGALICKRPLGHVKRGDCVAVLAQDTN
jgi:predicted deacylase